MNLETLKQANEIVKRLEDLRGHYAKVKEREFTGIELATNNHSTVLKVGLEPMPLQRFKLQYLQNISIEISRLENLLSTL